MQIKADRNWSVLHWAVHSSMPDAAGVAQCCIVQGIQGPLQATQANKKCGRRCQGHAYLNRLKAEPRSRFPMPDVGPVS